MPCAFRGGENAGKSEMGDASFRKHRPCSEEGRGSDYSEQRTFKLLFTDVRGGHDVSACIPDKVKPRRSCLPQVQSRRRYEPELNLQLRAASTVDRIDAAGIDTARVDQVILGAIGAGQAFAFARAVANDCGAVSWIVLQLNRVVVESGLLVVETNVAVLVELTRHQPAGLTCTVQEAVRLQLGSTPPISTVAVIEPPPTPVVSTVIELVP